MKKFKFLISPTNARLKIWDYKYQKILLTSSDLEVFGFEKIICQRLNQQTKSLGTLTGCLFLPPAPPNIDK